MLDEAHQVPRRVAQYMDPATTVQRICDHPVQIIALHKEITDLTS